MKTLSQCLAKLFKIGEKYLAVLDKSRSQPSGPQILQLQLRARARVSRFLRDDPETTERRGGKGAPCSTYLEILA